MTKLVGVHEAKTQFSRLLVEVGRGEETGEALHRNGFGVQPARLHFPRQPLRGAHEFLSGSVVEGDDQLQSVVPARQLLGLFQQAPDVGIEIVPFADDAEIPGTWLCRNGLEGTLIEGAAPEAKKVKPPRTHWDMLLERRSVDELDELLKERLDLLKVKRRGVTS